MLERQLARHLIQESMWDYATSRRRLFSPLWLMSLGGISSALAGIGFQMMQTGTLRASFEPNSHPHYRLIGGLLCAGGACLYASVLLKPGQLVDRRVARLGGPETRLRQLIALEARTSYAPNLESIKVERGNSGLPRIVAWLRRNRWKKLDKFAATLPEEGGTPPA